MKNLLFDLKAVKTGTHKALFGAGSRAGNFLKVGARAKTNRFGSATLPKRLCRYGTKIYGAIIIEVPTFINGRYRTDD
jgi:hypothetical protein